MAWRVRAASRLALGLALWMMAWPGVIVRPDPGNGGSRDAPKGKGLIQFEDRQSFSGIDFVLDNGTTPEKPSIDSMLGGVTFLDFDNDGWTDLYVTGVNRNFLYRNRRDGSFADVSERAGVSGLAGGKKLWSVDAAWLDYDNDGRLDLFVANYLDWSSENNRLCGVEGQRLSCSPTYYDGLPDLLYRNEGAGRFTDVSGSTEIDRHIGTAMSVAVADADGDGFADIFVANDQRRHFLFRIVGGRDPLNWRSGCDGHLSGY